MGENTSTEEILLLNFYFRGEKKKNILRSKGSRGHIMIIKNRYIYRSVEHQKVVSIIKDKIG